MSPRKEQSGQGTSYPMQSLKLPLLVSFDMLPRWLLDITHEIRTYRCEEGEDWSRSLVCFKPTTGDQIIRAEAFAIEITKICQEERQEQQRKAMAGGAQ
ncbi:hypothetical protein [Aeromonas jandaei]|uniref:hypothetical protein n=1 Tax=Aeromonas jandaei TaxID=650 RepID=UPI001ADDE122|nr:hypothetical protein [Aeromonas jandaei]QTL95328.1 hypothetical protein AjGTCBM29_03237 [Aeromonas jandaei]